MINAVSLTSRVVLTCESPVTACTASLSPSMSDGVRRLLRQFLARTQIPWMWHVAPGNGGGGTAWRVIWFLVILTGVAMAVVQSWTAMVGYSSYDVTLQTTFVLNATLPFPAVTICSNSPLDWHQEQQRDTAFYRRLNGMLNDDRLREQYNDLYRKKGKPYEEFCFFDLLSRFPVDASLGVGDDVVVNILWNGTSYACNGPGGSNLRDLDARGIVRRFRDFYYGSCFTFNAGVDPETQLEASALTGIEFILDWDIKNRYPYLDDPAAVLLVHPAGTAPVFGDGNAIKVYPKDEVTVGVKERLIARLPAPYPSSCVSAGDQVLRANSVYYEASERRYLYSIEACINSCIQKLSLDLCRCFDYQIPLGIHLVANRSDSRVCPARCSKIDGLLNLHRCRCFLPCQEITLDVLTSVKSNLVEEVLTSEASADDGVNVTSTTKTRVKVFLKTSVLEYSNEVPRYTIAEFWGVVGGNAAFWIGISAVTLFELVEFAARVTAAAVLGPRGIKRYPGSRKRPEGPRRCRDRRQQPRRKSKDFAYTYETVAPLAAAQPPPYMVLTDYSLAPYYNAFFTTKKA